jgi:hypothetical protein
LYGLPKELAEYEMTAAPPQADTLTTEERDAADALYTAVAAGTLYALLRSSDRRRRELIELMIIRHERILRDIGGQLIDGAIGLPTWERSTQQALRPLHLATTATLIGGFAALTSDHVLALELAIAAQWVYLRRFRQQIASAEQLLDGTLLARMVMYARAAYGVAQQTQRQGARAQGTTEERRMLSAAEHCGTCLDEAAKGWQPAGVLRAIGDSECLTNCRCHFEYR